MMRAAQIDPSLTFSGRQQLALLHAVRARGLTLKRVGTKGAVVLCGAGGLYVLASSLDSLHPSDVEPGIPRMNR